MLKRPRGNSDANATTTTPHPPSKRTQQYPPGSSPYTPHSSAGSSTPHSVNTPRTPFSIPSDSPSNPFGLKKSLVALDLPKPITFGKHLALRFQLVQETNTTTSGSLPSINNTKKKQKVSVFRVVQVPTNYSVRHLHKLLLFLFASDVERYHASRQLMPRVAKGKAREVTKNQSAKKATTTKSTRSHRTTASGCGSATPFGSSASPDDAPVSKSARLTPFKGHVFEVLKGKGLVKNTEEVRGLVPSTGKLWRKLSSVREKHIFRDLYGATDTGSKAEDTEDDDDEDWQWEAEDDFTLGNVWPKGPTLDRGIIYRHSPTTSIHITANTLSIPGRKGIGNQPFVFIAHGFARDAVKMSHVIHEQTEEGSHPPQESEYEIVNPPCNTGSTAGCIVRWNAPGSFPKFLMNEDERERQTRGGALQCLADTLDSGPILSRVGSGGRTASSPIRPPSNVVPLCPSDDEDADDGSESDYSIYSDSVLFPYATSAITPFPAHPAHRKRVMSAGRRLEKLTMKGLSTSQLSDSDSEGSEGGERAPSVEIPDGPLPLPKGASVSDISTGGDGSGEETEEENEGSGDEFYFPDEPEI